MFADLLRIVAAHRLMVPSELAAVCRMLATAEGALGTLAPDFDLVAESRVIAGSLVSEQLTPAALQHTALAELAALTPILRRLDRIANAAEHGRFGIRLRMLADEDDRDVLTGMLHLVVITVLAATAGVMAVLLLGTTGGPQVTDGTTLFQLIGYNLLVLSAILGLRALAPVFRRGSG